ncbi:hypothetical protein LPB41_02120 [Thalassospira sp. MA62]|nr:hypothetical protein [Thalassospira sp. MA62]
MLIRKLFTFENAHLVRGRGSRRCSHSIYGNPFGLVHLNVASEASSPAITFPLSPDHL